MSRTAWCATSDSRWAGSPTSRTARSSPRLRAKILNHPKYGPPVRAWQERGAVSRLAKLWAVSAMSFGVGLSWWLGIDPRVVLAQAVICASVGLYVVTRPSV